VQFRNYNTQTQAYKNLLKLKSTSCECHSPLWAFSSFIEEDASNTVLSLKILCETTSIQFCNTEYGCNLTTAKSSIAGLLNLLINLSQQWSLDYKLPSDLFPSICNTITYLTSEITKLTTISTSLCFPRRSTHHLVAVQSQVLRTHHLLAVQSQVLRIKISMFPSSIDISPGGSAEPSVKESLRSQWQMEKCKL